MVYGKDNKLICLYFLNSTILLKVLMFERGSPSLVGRGIANPMFGRTRGFESHSPRPTRGVYRHSQVGLEASVRCLTFRDII